MQRWLCCLINQDLTIYISHLELALACISRSKFGGYFQVFRGKKCFRKYAKYSAQESGCESRKNARKITRKPQTKNSGCESRNDARSRQ